MTIPKPETFFPELAGDQRERADEWLYAYLQLIIRIHRERSEATALDLSTAARLTDSEVLARSVRPVRRARSTISDE